MAAFESGLAWSTEAIASYWPSNSQPVPEFGWLLYSFPWFLGFDGNGIDLAADAHTSTQIV